jgi:hypothetical protein
MIKSRKMRWAGHVARMEARRNIEYLWEAGRKETTGKTKV